MPPRPSWPRRYPHSPVAGLLITLPSFTGTASEVRHFFGTRHSEVQPPVPAISNGSHPDRSGKHKGLKVSRPPGVRGRQPIRVVSVNQVHGTDVLVLDRAVAPGETFTGGWDALVTDQSHVLLTVRTADCVPVLIHDPRKRVVAAVHAGWRGAVDGIFMKTLEVLKNRFRCDPVALRVGIGPSAGPCCYEDDAPLLERLRAGFPQWSMVTREIGVSKAMLDLRGLVRRQAESAGVLGEHIRTAGACTVCHSDLFFSYRRQGVVRGTMVSGIMLDVRGKKG